MSTGYTEDILIEKPSTDLLGELGWECLCAFNEFNQDGGSSLGRQSMGEVALVARLRPALSKLNSKLPSEAIEQAIEELMRDRSAMSLVNANRQIYGYLKDGIKVRITNQKDGSDVTETVRVIDWNEPTNNDFLLVSQFWVTGDMYTRRADLVGFVNGLPLLFIELKASHVNLKHAFDDNLKDYKDTIPHLFWYNAFIILSNGSKSRIGSITAGWEHFAEWKKINSEGEQGIISLETMIRGTCEKNRFLDIVESFILFKDVRGGLIKLTGKNHQYLGVNNAIARMLKIREMDCSLPALTPEVHEGHAGYERNAVKENEADYRGKGEPLKPGQLGVFWHTQGSGKSVSMIFFAQKVLRKLPGNWSFVLVTDREELDNQIYKEFVSAGAITKNETQANSATHLRQLLGENHRYIFTLIHKFRAEKGVKHPVVSERSDIIVITDEAHRSQYDRLALNMRAALPNASFIAFTGTPLIAGEELTKEVFGDYVSVYNFKQSIEDEATVPLYYENRIPELQIINDDLNDDIYEAIERAELDEAQQEKLERDMGRQYHLITRDDRQEAVARDIVAHFMGRGYRGKAMVISIDKAAAVRMYDKVQKHRQSYISDLKGRLSGARDDEKSRLQSVIRYLEETDMAVVVSQGQNEIDQLRKKGLDIKPHRKRMVEEDLETKFKTPTDPLRIVFVCAMWITGFDVPECSTIYLDKPMRNHTLMQTIARANRVCQGKVNGLIVDYVGVFRSLQKALAIYGTSTGDGGEAPVKDKKALVEMLKNAIAEAYVFCKGRGVSIEAIKAAKGFELVSLLDDAYEAIVVSDEMKKAYLTLAGNVKKIFKALLPDAEANDLAPDCVTIDVIAKRIRSEMPPADITEVMGEIERILDESITAEGFRIEADPNEETARKDYLDLSKIDFDLLAEKFKQGKKRAVIERLKAAIDRKLQEMVLLNRTRMDYLEKFQKMIAEYNSGSRNILEFYEDLKRFVESLTKEEQRHIAEQLSEEELTIFDLLTKPEMDLTDEERKQVKMVAKELLEKLKQEKFGLDWRKRQEARAGVQVSISEILDHLPPKYTQEIYDKKCQVVFQHVYESYFGSAQSLYAF